MEFITAGGLMDSWRCGDIPHSPSKTVAVNCVDTEQLSRSEENKTCREVSGLQTSCGIFQS